MYDAVHLFATALDQLDQSQVGLQVQTNDMSYTNYATGDFHQASQLLWRRYLGSWKLTHQLYETGKIQSLYESESKGSCSW